MNDLKTVFKTKEGLQHVLDIRKVIIVKKGIKINERKAKTLVVMQEHVKAKF